jgi:hypothetical protein
VSSYTGDRLREIREAAATVHAIPAADGRYYSVEAQAVHDRWQLVGYLTEIAETYGAPCAYDKDGWCAVHSPQFHDREAPTGDSDITDEAWADWTLQSLSDKIVKAVDERPLSLDEKVLETATRLLEQAKGLDARIPFAVDLLTEIGVDLTAQASRESAPESTESASVFNLRWYLKGCDKAKLQELYGPTFASILLALCGDEGEVQIQESIYRESISDMVEDAERAAGWDPNP